MNKKRFLASFLSVAMLCSPLQGSNVSYAKNTPSKGFSKSTKVAVAIGGMAALAAVGVPLLLWGLSKDNSDSREPEKTTHEAKKSPKSLNSFESKTSPLGMPDYNCSVAQWFFSMHKEHEKGNCWYHTLNGGSKFADDEPFPEWCRGAKGLIAGSASYLGDLVNRSLAPIMKEVKVDVYKYFAFDEENSRCPGNIEIDSKECGYISELDQARKILREHPEAKGKIAVVDATNNVYKGGGPTRCSAQEESLVVKSTLGVSLLSEAAKLYYDLGKQDGHKPWNCIFAHDVVFYPESYLEETVSMRQDLKPEKVNEILNSPGEFYNHCDKFHVLGIAAPTQRQAGEITNIKANFVEQFRQIYSVAREHGVEYIVMVKFGTGAFASDREEAEEIWNAAHKQAFEKYGGGIKEFIVNGPECKKSDDANKCYFNRAVDALQKIEPAS